jgi:ribosomal protein S27E
MSMNLIELAKRRDEINAFSYKVHCANCGNLQYSLFDKLWVSAFDNCWPKCSDITLEESVMRGNNIFEIIGTWND